MNTDLVLLAVSLSLSCLALLGVLFSTEGKGTPYMIGMGLLWLVVLLAAAAAWTAVAGRIPEHVVHQIEGWYWWLLPIFCGYVSYQNYTKQPLSTRQLMRMRLIGALVVCALLIALVAALWPESVAPAVEKIQQNQRTEMKADSALADSIGKIDTQLATAKLLDSLQTDSLYELHSQLLGQGQQTAQELADLKATLLTPKPQTDATATQTDTRPAAALTRGERKKLRRAARKHRRDARARRDSLRHAGME